MKVHARNTHLDAAFKEEAATKVGHATRYLRIGEVDLEVSEESNPRLADERFRVEVTMLAAGRTVRIEAAAATPVAALDLAVDRLDLQLRRLKEKLKGRSRNHRPEREPEEEAASDDEQVVDIVKLKQFVMKPMTTEEAVMQMELLGHGFFFFQNSETDLPTVIYRRRDGAYGMIEPA